MGSPRPFEEELLKPTSEMIDSLCKEIGNNNFEGTLQILEATSSRIGGFELESYFETFGIDSIRPVEELATYGATIANLLSDLPIHPALAISALAREPLHRTSQRSSGAYHTDFRLAQFIASMSKLSSDNKLTVLDPACGAGILLVAVGISIAGADRQKAANWIANYVFASDLSEAALRATRLSLAALTNDVVALRSMWNHFRCQDSLMASSDLWNTLSPHGFDLVVGNPPWEKVKLTRHEYLQAQGHDRHYGSRYKEFDASDYKGQKRRVAEYATVLARKYDLIGMGEVDLYQAFLQLVSKLVRPGGRVAILIPAGLIRSQGTSELRKYLINESSEFSLSILENRAKFFEIDTRFKFLALTYVRTDLETSTRRQPIHLLHASGTAKGVNVYGDALIGRKALKKIRPDFSVPEVRNTREWNLYKKMTLAGEDWSKSKSPWCPSFLREVDMTSERSNFLHEQSETTLPLIEGRMIQSHRFGAKSYVSGTGRRAVWTRTPAGTSQIVPQFWIEPDSLRPRAAKLCQEVRAGFCDITGQTNERSMMAALILPGVVCGNKVPTVIFPNDTSTDRIFVWLAIVNSLPFDWLLRRVITTTVNFFLLVGTPLPVIEKDSLVWRRLLGIAKQLQELDCSGPSYDPLKVATLKADADLLVAIAYGLNFTDLVSILEDFSLFDRGQPPILSEAKSTITKDFLLSRAVRRYKIESSQRRILEQRVNLAIESGAIPYISSEFATLNGETTAKSIGNAS